MARIHVIERCLKKMHVQQTQPCIPLSSSSISNTSRSCRQPIQAGAIIINASKQSILEARHSVSVLALAVLRLHERFEMHSYPCPTGKGSFKLASSVFPAKVASNEKRDEGHKDPSPARVKR